MKTLLLNAALLLSVVAVSLSYSIKDENNMSELVENNIEALNQQEEIEGCIIQHGGKCLELYVEANGGSGVHEYPNYINYMEVLDE